MKKLGFLIILFLLSCSKTDQSNLKNQYSELIFRKKEILVSTKDSAEFSCNSNRDPSKVEKPNVISNSNKERQQIVDFAQKFLGVPYLYGSADPENGFDCSGFINYVYRHFGYEVPRSSKDFFDFGKEISIENVRKGDLLIFNGTDLNSPEIGHVGIVLNANGTNSEFIHSSSGKANGVTVSSLSEPHYSARFVKAISVID